MLSIYNKKVKPFLFDSTIFHIEHEKIVAPYSESKYLVFSSCFFIIPSVYAFMNYQHFYAITSLLTSICSINYWRDARYCYRRSTDLVMAKISFTIYFINGCYYTALNGYGLMICKLFGLILSLFYFYYMSCNTASTCVNIWYKYHMMFHFVILCGMMVTIESAINYEKKQQNC